MPKKKKKTHGLVQNSKEDNVHKILYFSYLSTLKVWRCIIFDVLDLFFIKKEVTLDTFLDS